MSKLKKSLAGVAVAAGVLGGGLAMAPGADAAGWGGGGVVSSGDDAGWGGGGVVAPHDGWCHAC